MMREFKERKACQGVGSGNCVRRIGPLGSFGRYAERLIHDSISYLRYYPIVCMSVAMIAYPFQSSAFLFLSVSASEEGGSGMNVSTVAPHATVLTGSIHEDLEQL